HPTTPSIHTLSLHDALPISPQTPCCTPTTTVAPLFLSRRSYRERVLSSTACNSCSRFDPSSASSFLKFSSRLVSSAIWPSAVLRSEEHTSELQSRGHLVCRL